jgi:hypothetical protein
MWLEGPIWICTGSQKGEKERVEDSMYLIPEAGGVYSTVYTAVQAARRGTRRGWRTVCI